MRVLGLVICAFLLAACTGDESAQPPANKALTAEKVLGDYGTVDYCALLDTSTGTTVSSFETCRVEENGIRRIVGPVRSDAELGLDPEYTRVYRYPGDLPAGVAVREPTQDLGPACVRHVGFSDHIWLMVAVSDSKEPASSTATERCASADELVAGVLAAIAGGKVEHASYGPDSFGSLDPCTLLGRPEIENIAGPSAVVPSTHGHDCTYGDIGLRFGVDAPSVGTPETLGGRQVTVSGSVAQCTVGLDRPLPDRPLPDRPGLVEKATVTRVISSGGEDLCQDARAAAGVLFPDLPQYPRALWISSSTSAVATNSSSSPASSGSSGCGTITRPPRRIVTSAASRGRLSSDTARPRTASPRRA